ncbi:MAG: hypothetical protein ITG01_14645 [Comamonas sp.]|jgi:hypothetical protein|nr:hypothetical protein [Comamonas sp.]
MEVLFIILAASCLLLWGLRRRLVSAVSSDREVDAAAAPAAKSKTAVAFRVQGERGKGGPVFGDVLCSDGVYLPKVWESDFHTSFDGRWIRTGSYGASVPRLLDRKSRRSWTLSVSEASTVDDLHWRLPRWNGEAQGGNGVAQEAQAVFADAEFDAWLTKNIQAAPQALVGICDLWIPADCLPENLELAPPAVAQPEGAAVELSVQRHWPASLRNLPNPLEPLFTPYWQLVLQGEAHSWIIDGNTPVVWRGDGQAFACYGYPVVAGGRSPQLRLGVWSLAQGGQQWSAWMPTDRKAWHVSPYMPDPSASSVRQKAALQWDGETLLQRMEVDTPQLERLHDGRLLSATSASITSCVQHRLDGRPVIKPVPKLHFFWRRDVAQPSVWQAQSEPLGGHALQWTLVHEAKEDIGATAAYSLQWGDTPIPGLWELEHVLVQSRWAVLCAWSEPANKGGRPVPWIWDGKQLHVVEMPGPMVRMRPLADVARVEVLVMAGCGPESTSHTNTGSWRWPIQPVKVDNVAKEGWKPSYEIRQIAPDPSGRWRLLPRWREVSQVQHPCADGDYVWPQQAGTDALWWWGGLHLNNNNQWDVNVPRTEGVTVTKSGAVLCATGPSACPHPSGDGWLVLEWLARSHDEPNYWKLHWLRPAKREVRTLELRAYLPLLQAWDAQQGILWMDSAEVVEEGEAPKQHIIADINWEGAPLEMLKQSAGGLWIRKQDAVYADTIAVRDDWPWPRAKVAAA